MDLGNPGEAELALVGIILFLIGLGMMYFARQSEGVSGAVLFLLGLLLIGFGIYALVLRAGPGRRALAGGAQNLTLVQRAGIS